MVITGPSERAPRIGKASLRSEADKQKEVGTRGISRIQRVGTQRNGTQVHTAGVVCRNWCDIYSHRHHRHLIHQREGLEQDRHVNLNDVVTAAHPLRVKLILQNT